MRIIMHNHENKIVINYIFQISLFCYIYEFVSQKDVSIIIECMSLYIYPTLVTFSPTMSIKAHGSHAVRRSVMS